MLHEVKEISLEKLWPSLLVGLELLQQMKENVQANLRHIAHGVFEGPHHRVHEDLELRSRDLKES